MLNRPVSWLWASYSHPFPGFKISQWAFPWFRSHDSCGAAADFHRFPDSDSVMVDCCELLLVTLIDQKKSPASMEKAGDGVSFPSVLTIEERVESIQAGLLALGSPYSSPLPRIASSGSASFVPHHSGGSAPGFHGIPFSIPTIRRDHLNRYVKNGVVITE